MKKTIFFKNRIKTIILLEMSAILLFLTACSNNHLGKYETYTQNATYFDTLISISIIHNNSEAANSLLDDCLKICDKYEAMLDDKVPSSDIYLINHAGENKVKVNPETITILNSANLYSQKSNGLFDITVKGATSLWDFHGNTNLVPDNQELEKALKHINYKNISIDQENNLVSLSDSQTQIDIGGIAKGFIADQIKDYLLSQNVTGAIINIGGDITTLGHKTDNKPFTIGITDPFGNSQAIMGVEITDMSIATSGTYERSFESDGILYHHILNPHTGYPVDTDISSATTITPAAIDADSICTIAILLGSKEAINFIESIPDTEGIIICTDGSILTSSGADKYIIH